MDQGSRPVFAVGGVPGPDLAGIALETGLTFGGTPLDPGGVPVRKARIGLYQPWTASMDEGWIRWLLEQYRFEYTSLHNERFREGDLAADLDVIVLPSVAGRTIIEGRSPRNTPEPYAGGIGEEGVATLLDFVRGGGTLVAHGASCAFAIDAFGLPVRNAMRDIVSEGFYAAGSGVRMDYGETWGMDGAQGIAFFSSRLAASQS